jgi:prevent-host-death family protein
MLLASPKSRKRRLLGLAKRRGSAAHWLSDEVRRRGSFDISNGAQRLEPLAPSMKAGAARSATAREKPFQIPDTMDLMESRMRRFTTVDIDENLGDVKAAASRGPIVITEHGENRFVMLSIEDFERLRKAGVPQRAFGAGETPPEIAAPLLGFFYAKVRKTTRAKMVGQG